MARHPLHEWACWLDHQTRVVKEKVGGKCEKVIHLAAVPAWTVPWVNKSPSLEISVGTLSSFLSEKKFHILVKNVLRSTCNCQKPNCRQKSIWQNPLTALIQFLKEISCWKVTEKPSYCTWRLGVSKLSVLRESPCLMFLLSMPFNQWINK